MQVLHVIDSAGLYGAEHMLLDLAAEQADLGHRPVIASVGARQAGEKAIEREAAGRGIQVQRFRMRNGLNYQGGMDILRFAWREGIDLLHSHGYKGNILLGAIPRRWRRLPLVTTVHGYTSLQRLTRMKIYEWLDARLLKYHDAVVLVDGSVRDHPRLRGISLPAFQVVHNGIRPFPDMKPPVALSADVTAFCSDGFTAGAIGRLAPEKGFLLLLEGLRQALDQGADLRLLLIGEGSERPALEERIATLGLQDRTFLAGYRSSASRYLPLLRGFVQSSLSEGLPITILEAMQAKVPILATRVGAVPEVLGHGEAGILVEAGSAEALASGLLTLYGNPEQAERMAGEAHRRVNELYSCRRMALQYEEVYKSLLTRPEEFHG